MKSVSGQTLVAEGVGILNLLRKINKKTSHLESGAITVFSDMKKIVNEVRYKVVKESQCVREASATIMAIKKEIDNATITVELEYSNKKIRQDRPFQQNPGFYLINECDVKSKQMRKELLRDRKYYAGGRDNPNSR